jgi:chitinase
MSPVSSSATKQVGVYFAEWGIYTRGFTIKNLDTSGQASKLTFVNYAFANIYESNGGTTQ